MNSTIPVSSVPEYIEKIITLPNLKYARGEPRKYEKPFLPGIWRENNSHIDRTPVSDSSMYTVGELDVLHNFQKKILAKQVHDPYFETFIGNIEEEININSESLWHWTSLAQHYGEPTRLVDITSDSLAALYFATQTHDEYPGYVHIFRDNFNEVTRNNLSKVNFGCSFFDIESIEDEIDGRDSVNPSDNTSIVIIPSFPNRRIEAQKGCFCFTRRVGIQAYWGGQLTFEITNKPQIRMELQRLGYTNETMFPNEYRRA